MRAINATMLGLGMFLVTYCLCFWFGVMPKFYPLLNEIHIVPPPGNHVAVKFVGSAVVGMAAGLVGVGIGLLLPATSRRVRLSLHLPVWGVFLAACIYLIGRETLEYIVR